MKKCLSLPALIGLLALPGGNVAAAKKKTTRLKPYSWTSEVELLKRVDLLPLYRDGMVEQVSSYDPTGGNEDGFAGKYSYIRKEGDKLVLAELEGPGVIQRIWTPTPTDDMLEFYFDGEQTPRLRLRFSDLFSGKVYPFVKPVCANEIGGYYCYVPIPYAKSCKIVFCGKKIMFHQFQYRSLPGYDVKTWTGEFTPGERDMLASVCRVWSEISPACTDYAVGQSEGARLVEKRFTLLPGDETVFFEQRKGGRIAGFEIDGGASFEGFDRDVLLCARWDDDTRPAIHAPLADFFGYAYGKKAMRSMLIGCRGDVNYCYLPAPFDARSELKLRYVVREGARQNPIQVTTRVWVNDRARDIRTEGRLYTAWRREINPAKGEYYKFLSKEGRGHYVGTVHQAQGFLAEMTGFFEGDDSTYMDGKMRLHGTGSEDYYNGGWYAMLDRWDRGVSLPLHGSLDYSLPMARTGGYRFYMNDKLSFEREFYMGIEHGPSGNEYPVDYTSVAFFYGETPATECMEPTQRLRTVYIPDRHTFYPQAMRLSLGNNAQVRFGDFPRGMTVSSRGTGLVRVLLEDVPEGRYRIYFDYYAKPSGAEFSVWQRQGMLSDWRSSKAETEKLVSRFYAGDIVLTPQTNSVSFQIRGNNYRSEFEFANIYLERIPE